MSNFIAEFIQIPDPIRRNQTKVKAGSQSRRKYSIWGSRSYRRWDMREHFSNVA